MAPRHFTMSNLTVYEGTIGLFDVVLNPNFFCLSRSPKFPERQWQIVNVPLASIQPPQPAIMVSKQTQSSPTRSSFQLSSPSFFSLPPTTATAACPRPADSRPASRHTDTPSTKVPAAEHGRVAEHVRHDEEADVGAADIDLVKMGDAAVAGGDCDVLELDVHVVLS